MKNETKKHYNPIRVMARFRCLITLMEYQREINILSEQHETREASLVHVRRQLERWANEQHDAVLELTSWAPYPTE